MGVTSHQGVKVASIHMKTNRAVIAELQDLLRQAVSGELIGLGYTTITRGQAVRAGVAGTLARDKWKAATAFYTAAAQAAMQKDEPR